MQIFNYINISVSLHCKGWQLSCHIITGGNVKDLSPENVYPMVFYTKISVRLYQKGWQFSCHLLTGRNVKDLSPENV